MKRTAIVAMAMVLGLGGASCAGEEPTITVYSGRTENLIGPILENFT